MTAYWNTKHSHGFILCPHLAPQQTAVLWVDAKPSPNRPELTQGVGPWSLLMRPPPDIPVHHKQLRLFSPSDTYSGNWFTHFSQQKTVTQVNRPDSVCNNFFTFFFLRSGDFADTFIQSGFQTFQSTSKPPRLARGHLETQQ